MLTLWKTHRARRAAKMAIRPLVEATRFRHGAIPDGAWQDAYVVGFVATLITMFATQQSGPLRADSLASVQSGAWTDITNTPGELAGEQILFFSVARDMSFLKGCRNAELFFQSLNDGQAAGARGFGDEDPIDDDAEGPAAIDEISLWTYYFENHISAYGDPATS